MRHRTRVAAVAAVGVLVVGVLAAGLAYGMGCCGGMSEPAAPSVSAASASSAPAAPTASSLDAAVTAVDAAAKALAAGDQKTAAAELAKARRHLEALQKETAAAAAPQFANTRCPIMGSPIDPAKVPEGLTRTYKGKKIAFCCGGCPAKWDQLTDAEKDARLR